jgi:hypothetical protein
MLDDVYDRSTILLGGVIGHRKPSRRSTRRASPDSPDGGGPGREFLTAVACAAALAALAALDDFANAFVDTLAAAAATRVSHIGMQTVNVVLGHLLIMRATQTMNQHSTNHFHITTGRSDVCAGAANNHVRAASHYVNIGELIYRAATSTTH